VKKENDVNIN